MAIQVVSLPERSYRLALWQRFYLWEIIGGLMVTGKHLIKNILGLSQIKTYEYPEMLKEIPDGYKAEHRLMQRPDRQIRCTACMLCATACPSNCIDIVASESDDPKIEKFPIAYTVNQLRCVYCGLCVEACPCDAVRMDTKIVDKSGYSREDFILDIEYLRNNHPKGMSPYSVAIY